MYNEPGILRDPPKERQQSIRKNPVFSAINVTLAQDRKEKTMKKMVFLLFVAVAMLSGCKRLATIQNHEEVPVVRYDGQSLTLEQIERAIQLAGLNQGWVMKEVTPGHMVGTLEVRGKHRATVDIFFDTEQYTVQYKDSMNLRYVAPSQIHPNYNRWVATLVRYINDSIQHVE